MKIGFVGAPNSGKTTVAQRVAAELRFKTGKRVELIDEYARSFVSKFGVPTVFDQYFIATRQLDKERAITNADILITDSPAFLSLVYAHRVMDKDDEKQKTYFHELNRMLSSNLNSYDEIFYFPPIIKNANDGHRVHIDPKVLREIDDEIRAFMTYHRIRYNLVKPKRDSLAARVRDVINFMDGRNV